MITVSLQDLYHITYIVSTLCTAMGVAYRVGYEHGKNTKK
jgi:hypothetical protein